jgi:L-lactate utilization protein LutB
VWKAVFGDFKSVSEMFMDCVMCGMCTPVCIADIAPNLVALYVSRAQGAHFTEKPVGLDARIKEIEDGRFNDEWRKILKMNDKELADHCATVK